MRSVNTSIVWIDQEVVLWRTTRVSVGKFPRTSAFNINQHWHLIIHLSSQSFKLCSFEAISDQGPKRYEVLGKLTWWKFMLEYVKATRKKTRIFYSQADRKRCSPPLYGRLFLIFILVFFWPYLMIICFLKRILHKKKSISMQLLESPIPPLTAAALRIIMCKRPAPHFDNHEKGMKYAFWDPSGLDKMCF